MKKNSYIIAGSGFFVFLCILFTSPYSRAEVIINCPTLLERDVRVTLPSPSYFERFSAPNRLLPTVNRAWLEGDQMRCKYNRPQVSIFERVALTSRCTNNGNHQYTCVVETRGSRNREQRTTQVNCPSSLPEEPINLGRWSSSAVSAPITGSLPPSGTVSWVVCSYGPSGPPEIELYRNIPSNLHGCAVFNRGSDHGFDCKRR